MLVTVKRHTATANTEATMSVTVDIRSGPVTPAMKANWIKWWQRLIGECKGKLETDQREEKLRQTEPPDDGGG